MLKFAAITPHPPIIIPNIGKENMGKLKKTQESFELLKKNLIKSEIETLIIISPHGPIQSDYFSINLSPDFNIKFENFGDLASKLELSGDIVLANQIWENTKTKTSVNLITAPDLDHGSGVPLFSLLNNLKNIKIVPIYFSFLSLEEHFNFGKLINQEIKKSDKKIAVIASGDLSHRLTEDAPAGYSPKGAKFDNKLIELIKNKKTQEILELSPKLIDDAGECGLRSICILLGILDKTDYESQILSYEGPFGVGYLTANFKLK